MCGRRWVCGGANIMSLCVCESVCVRVSRQGTPRKGAHMVYISYIEHTMGANNEAAHLGRVTLDDQLIADPHG